MPNGHLPSHDLNQCISDFFREPTTPPTASGYLSSLYLLRRDSAQCLGYDPNSFQRFPLGTARALWLGLMGIFSGIDLLGKFYQDNDDTGGGRVGIRFRAFLGYFVIPSNPPFIEPIWRLRNSIMHSFGLYGGQFNGREEWYVLSAGGSLILDINETQTERYICLDIIRFWEAFEHSIQPFRNWLNCNLSSLANFQELLRRYGFSPISPQTMPSVSTLTGPPVTG
jgi:hypothetical protein